MFYRSLASRIRPSVQHQRAATREARNDFVQSLQLSDGYLFFLIIGGSMFARWLDMKTRWEVYCATAAYVLLFLVYVLLKKREQAQKPVLDTELEKID